ncbi:MAG: AAA family ATPase, partial [Anaerolineae bacterium]|nr:AAA family ATPase [Anaerolineae bacterium]
MAHLALFLFGSPRLELNGTTIEIARRKAMALIAYLAVTGQEHSRDTLATLLWPDYDQTRARGALRRTLSVLNKALGGDWLETSRETITLAHTPDLWLDVAQFRQQLAACQAHNHLSSEICSACLSALTQAAALYRDDFLAGFTLRDSPTFDDWQFFQAEELRRELAGCLERLAHYHHTQTEDELAITYARRWLELDPLHEPAHQLLMQLYAYTDQRAAALRQYQECVRIFEEELAAQPSAETTALYERIRTGNLSRKKETLPRARQEKRPTSAPPPPTASAPLTPPPFLSATPPRPSPLAPFVAREGELAQMSDYLKLALVGQGQVVFITGEAGSGKTALIQEFARRAQETTPNLLVTPGNCNAHIGSGDPYRPFREILGLLTGDIEPKWNQGAITPENAGRLWNLFPASVQALLEFGPDLIDTFIPRLTLSSRVQFIPGPDSWKKLIEDKNGGNGTANIAQNDLFEQFTHVIQALAKQQPLLLVIDDTQWADAASINLLFHLGRQITSNHILMVITYRSDDVALGRNGERHPLESVINELKRVYGDVQIDLDQSTGPQFVEALLDTQANQLAAEFRTALYRQTQGHPLFTVELLWAMQQRGDLVRNAQGQWVEGPKLNWASLPARVEAILKERLDRLADNLRHLLAVASVEGDRFTAQVIARVQGINERQLLQALSLELETRHRLIQAQGEVEVGSRFLSRYRFTHTLFQQYLYNHLGAGERRLLHHDIAGALEALYADQTGKITIQLAHHYTRAGQADKAIDYLLQAGDRARNLYA